MNGVPQDFRGAGITGKSIVSGLGYALVGGIVFSGLLTLPGGRLPEESFPAMLTLSGAFLFAVYVLVKGLSARNRGGVTVEDAGLAFRRSNNSQRQTFLFKDFNLVYAEYYVVRGVFFLVMRRDFKIQLRVADGKILHSYISQRFSFDQAIACLKYLQQAAPQLLLFAPAFEDQWSKSATHAHSQAESSKARYGLWFFIATVLCAIAGAVVMGVYPNFSAYKLDSAAREIYSYASSCPLDRIVQSDLDGNSSWTISIHRCDKSTGDSPQWLRDFSSQESEFVIVTDNSWFRKSIVGGTYTDGEYSTIEPTRFAGRGALFLVTTPEGSGGFVDWCVLGYIASELKCIPQPTTDDLDKNAERYLKAGEHVGAWSPDYRTDELTVTANVFGSEDANCCPSRGEIRIILRRGNQGFDVSKVVRVKSNA